jgi:hypothetical protein
MMDDLTYGQIMSSLGSATGCIERVIDLYLQVTGEARDLSPDEESEMYQKLRKAHEAILIAAATLERSR